MAASLEAAHAAIRRKYVEAGLAERADEFLTLARPAIFFHPSPRIFENDIPIGASKIGGRPDLPAEMLWPEDLRISGTQLTLLAQINLSDVLPGVLDIALPPEGTLLAFAAPNHFAVGRLIWLPPGTTLERRDAPPDCQVFPVRPLTPDIRMTLDSQREDLPPDDRDDARFVATEGREGEYVVQLGGDPFLIQNSLERECEQLARDKGRLTGDDARWVFMLQVDSVDEAEMMWGDGGSVYFYLRAADLRERRFGNAVVTMQCH